MLKKKSTEREQSSFEVQIKKKVQPEWIETDFMWRLMLLKGLSLIKHLLIQSLCVCVCVC